MPCFSPIQALDLGLKSNGKMNLKLLKTRFSDFSRLHHSDLLIPCGQCVGCRLERSRQWAVRCVHESELFDNNCFITLTFNDANLFSRDYAMSLDVTEFQRFMKRLRKRFDGIQCVVDDNGIDTYPIRFFHCGEYGDQFSRPHYHACLFNFDFPDKMFWKEVNGFKLYTSAILSELWPYGYSSVGSVTFESAAYVARYIMKKVTGKDSDVFYEFIDSDSGEWYRRKPEYTTMSRRPGVGKRWFDKYALVDTYPNDYVVMRGRKMRPPKFYDSKLPDDMLLELKSNRIAKALEFVDEGSPERLRVREKCATAKLHLFSRNVE